ncbi:MAG TPA: glycosyl transferase [Desulfovibrio sp.]|nr:glycosyl transferase [Desulfovibrio sp.]HBR06348.1 glycosyl transferase [Desulfovibrio sp.]
MNGQRLFGSLDPFLEPGPVLGRKMANAQFLRFLLTADPFDEYHFFLADQGLRDGLASQLARLFPDLWASGKVHLPDRRILPQALAAQDFHCFHQSDCILHQASLARVRNACSRRLFPITGPIHSLSYADYPARFLAHLWPGTTARDCIVATSRTGKQAVENQFASLRRDYGLSAEEYPAPTLAQIPLGVDPGEFQEPSREARQEARAALDLPQGRVLSLVFGRLSHYSKMDLLPLLRAFQSLFAQGADRASAGLVLAGWVEEGDDFPETIRGLAKNIGLELHLFARPDAERKARLYEACDLFVSIADNPQETFGLTLLEAAAAGLPVVASDYDGYKDLVVHGETGLLIPCTGLAETPAADLLAPVLPDNQYHLYLAQALAVDVNGLAQALESLTANPRLRLDMGRAGRRRALEEFSWASVIQRYLDLWEELQALPVDEAKARSARHPLHPAFGPLFGHYPTRTLAPDARLVVGRTGQVFYRGLDFPLVYAGLEGLVDGEALKKLVFLARKPVAAGEMQARLVELTGISADQAAFLVLWALKHDLLETAP